MIYVNSMISKSKLGVELYGTYIQGEYLRDHNINVTRQPVFSCG